MILPAPRSFRRHLFRRVDRHDLGVDDLERGADIALAAVFVGHFRPGADFVRAVVERLLVGVRDLRLRVSLSRCGTR